MSDVDLSEFRGAYLVEADELLATANRNLLSLEATARRGEHDVRALRDLFRAVHTIKGLSAMVGVEPIVAIAHRLETALRTVDRAGARLSPAAVDVMLAAVREVEMRVRAVAERREVPAASPALLEALEPFAQVASAPVAAAPAGVALDAALAAKIGAAEAQQLAQAIASGRRAVRVDFAPSSQKALEGVNITSVRERLSRLGDIVKVVPISTPVGEETPGGLLFSLLLVTTAADEALAAAAHVPLAAVTALSLAAAPAPAPEAPIDLALEEEPRSDERVRRGFVRVEVSRLDEAMERLSALVVTRYRLARAMQRLVERGADVGELREILHDNGRQLRDLRATLVRARMVPLAEVLDRVPLLVRGLSRSTGKQVRLELDVGATEVDKTVAERLFPALVHLVRNAVDHAIEPPEERARVGKPPEGRLVIAASGRSNRQLEIMISDDGRGVDAAAVGRRAGRDVPAGAAELLDLLCRPGLSTRESATTTSGRGMGMDIVRRIVVEELGGELQLETRAGQGTRFSLRVPLTIAIVDAFSVEAAGDRVCVPVSTVEEIIDVDADRIVRPPRTLESAVHLGMIERRGEAVPLFALAALLGHSSEVGGKALVVRRSGEPFAFAVDRLLGQQEVVVRPFEDPLLRVPGVTGATDLGDGRPTLVLELHALLGRMAADATVGGAA